MPIDVRERIVKRVARELHDQVGQILTAVKMHLHALYAMLILEIWMRLFIDLPLREYNKNLRLEDILK